MVWEAKSQLHGSGISIRKVCRSKVMQLWSRETLLEYLLCGFAL